MVLLSLSTVMTTPVSIQIGSECSDRKAATRRIEPFRAITWGCWCKAWTLPHPEGLFGKRISNMTVEIVSK